MEEYIMTGLMRSGDWRFWRVSAMEPEKTKL